MAASPLSDDVLATGGADGRFYVWHLSDRGRSASIHFFYRFPAPQMTTDLGITWLQSADLEGPLPQALSGGGGGGGGGGSNQGRRSAGAGGPDVTDDEAPQEERRGRQRAPVDGGLQTQRITCCTPLPRADGPGFIVATKAGVISLFAPNLDIDATTPSANDGVS